MKQERLATNSHRERHLLLHKMLDELVADWLGHTDCLLSKRTVFELMEWSHSQCKEPTEKVDKE